MSVRSSPEQHHWEHAAVVVPLMAGGLFAAVAVARDISLPWWYVPVAVLVTAGVATAAATAVTGSMVALSYAAATGVVAVAWATWTAITGPWSEGGVFALVIAALLFGLAYPVVRGHHKAAIAEAERRAEAARRAAEARKWPDLLARVGAKGVTVLSSEETRAGHAHRLKLPATGKVTFSKLEKLTEALETVASLRDGAIRFERGDHAGEAVMHVGEKDILAQLVPFPLDDLSDTTVNRPFGIGLFEDGTVCDVLFREIAALIIGLRGSGKSNTINVLIAQLARCVDTVIFMIDLKGGRAALPWIKPWLDGRTPRPVIDWVATTRDEAERMLAALLRGVDARSHSGAGGEKVTPSAATPAVVLVMDEMAVIFGAHGTRTADGATNTQLASMGTLFTQLGRSEAMDPVMATQRGTVTMTGGGDLKSQCKLRLGLGVASEADARYIIPDDASAARLLPKLKHPGSGIVSDHDTRVAPVKFYRLEPADVTHLAEELGDRRPEPDAVLTAAFGDDYARRWSHERAGHIPGFRRAMATTGGGSGDDDVRQQFEAIVAGAGLGDPGEDDRAHPARARMLELLRRAGVMGMTPKTIARQLDAEQLGVNRQTLHRWLREEKDTGRVVNASYGRWKAG